MKLHYLLILLLPVQFSVADDTAQTPKKTEDWRADMPEEVRAKLPEDTGNLLCQLGFDSRPESQTGRERPPVKVWGNNFSNFDKDDSNDWVVHVSSTNFQGKPISGTLVYDKTEDGWTCIAMLPGTWPIGWGGMSREGSAFAPERGFPKIPHRLRESPISAGTGRDTSLTESNSLAAADPTELANKASHHNPLPVPSRILAGRYNPQTESKARPR